MSNNQKCFTIGHSTLEWDTFFTYLINNNINWVVDIRAFPYTSLNNDLSLCPWFNFDEISKNLEIWGIQYTWMRSLSPETSDGKYDIVARENDNAYRASIGELLGILHKSQACILSSEGNPYISSRHLLVTQTLLKYMVDVEHIMPDGTLESAHSDIFHL